MSAHLTRKRPLLFGIAALLAVLFIINIEVDVPPNLRGPRTAVGHIAKCDFGGLGRNSGQFFLGITLNNSSAPYLRDNPPKSERAKFQNLCAQKAAVTISYRAKKRLIGPVRFWVQTLAEG